MNNCSKQFGNSDTSLNLYIVVIGPGREDFSGQVGIFWGFPSLNIEFASGCLFIGCVGKFPSGIDTR